MWFVSMLRVLASPWTAKDRLSTFWVQIATLFAGVGLLAWSVITYWKIIVMAMAAALVLAIGLLLLIALCMFLSWLWNAWDEWQWDVAFHKYHKSIKDEMRRGGGTFGEAERRVCERLDKEIEGEAA